MIQFRKSFAPVTLLGLAMTVFPVALNGHLEPGWLTVMAARGGNAGGKGGDSGGSNADGASAEHSNSNGTGSGESANAGRAGSVEADGHGAKASASNRELASAAGALNTAHASPNALAHAAANSRVGQVASYDFAMRVALSMPSNTLDEILARNAAIASARQHLASAANKALTALVVAQVDRRLGLPSTDPTLGLR